MKHALAISILAASALAGCGGGGGGASIAENSTTTATTTTTTIVPAATLTSGSISRYVVTGSTITVDVTAQTNFNPVGALYSKTSGANGIFSEAVQVTAIGNNTYKFTFSTLSTIADGSYSGNVTLHLCSPQACAATQAAPSISVPYTIHARSSGGIWPGNNLTALSAWPNTPDWTTYQGNASHTGYVSVEPKPDQFTLRWTANSLGMTNDNLYPNRAAITTWNGLFFAANGTALYARNEHDGSNAWTYNVSSLAYPSVNPPAVENGIVYMAAGQQSSTYLFGFTASDGTVLFRSGMSSQWENYLAPTVGANGVYTNAGTYGGLYAFDRNNGDSLFMQNAAQTSMWTPAVNNEGVYIYTGGILSVFHPTTGAVKKTITDPTFTNYVYEIGGSPVLGSAGSVFVANYANAYLNGGNIGNTLTRFDTTTDSIAWQVNGVYRHTPAYSSGIVYALNNKPYRLEARAESNGSLLWSWTPQLAADYEFGGEPLITSNLVILSTNQATYAIDLTSQKPVWSYPASGRLSLSKNGVLYIQNDSAIVAVNLK